MSAPTPADYQTAFGLLSHLFATPTLVALIQARVPDHLDGGPLPAAELATKSGLHELTMTRSLRALSAFGAFEETAPGVFANNAVSGLFRDQPGGLRNAALFWGGENLLKSAIELGHSVRTGEASFVHVFGESFWEQMKRLPEQHEMFNRALADLRSDEHQQIAAAYDWNNVKTFIDVGGGAGGLLAAALEQKEGLKGVLFDLPEVLPDAERLLTRRKVRERSTLIGGSFFEPIEATGEAWALSQILHDWPDKESIDILRSCRKAMREGDRLLVIEMLSVPCQPNPGVAILDWMMLLYFGEARQRTVEEYEALFDASGLELTRVLDTPTAFSIVEARPV